MKKMKLCIVAPFDSKCFFQWYVTLEKFTSKFEIILTSINASETHKKVYNDFKENPYWQPIREADAVFVYATRISSRNDPTGIEWWKLPQFVKQLMRPDAKMICQYDDEFMWLFDPSHVWWSWENPDNHGGPEQFFKDTGILEIPDVHLTVTNNPLFKNYTTKPIFKLLLPQLSRYRLFKYSETHVRKNIAILVHSIKKSSISGILENVIRPKNYPVTIFSGTLYNQLVEKFRQKESLPTNSIIYPRLGYEPYVDLLWQNSSIGLDDNTGYYGWSRFVMECAIAYVPCVGSTEAVQDIFPELYTVSQDYAKQIELIERLQTDSKFYHQMAEIGHKRVVEMLSDEKLCTALIEIFEKIGTPRTWLPPLLNPEYQASAHPHG